MIIYYKQLQQYVIYNIYIGIHIPTLSFPQSPFERIRLYAYITNKKITEKKMFIHNKKKIKAKKKKRKENQIKTTKKAHHVCIFVIVDNVLVPHRICPIYYLPIIFIYILNTYMPTTHNKHVIHNINCVKKALSSSLLKSSTYYYIYMLNIPIYANTKWKHKFFDKSVFLLFFLFYIRVYR